MVKIHYIIKEDRLIVKIFMELPVRDRTKCGKKVDAHTVKQSSHTGRGSGFKQDIQPLLGNWDN